MVKNKKAPTEKEKGDRACFNFFGAKRSARKLKQEN